jgi:alcohol dehydrogenase, propanol-preferring
MKAMLLKGVFDLKTENSPLQLEEVPIPVPGAGEILIKVSVCGVCHTELDEIEARTPPPLYPVIPGHQVVGEVVEAGAGVTQFHPGDRVGVAWIFSSCGNCQHCLSGNENLCSDFKATGRDANGGYAEYMKVDERFAHRIPAIFTDAEAAPLLCAGAVGYRSLRLTGIFENFVPAEGKTNNGYAIGLTGFGASGHLVLKTIRYKFPGAKVYVFARSVAERKFALELGATWAGDSSDEPPEMLDSVIDTTPVWKPVVEALRNLKPGGRLVINAIRKENTDKDYLLQLDYARHLWMEKEIKSVANVAVKDVREFLDIASVIPILPEIQIYRLEEANQALIDLKLQKIRGAKVLKISSSHP